MKKFLTFVVLAIIMPNMVSAQNNLSYSGVLDSFILEESDRTADYFVLGGSNSTDAPYTNITYVNNVRYENLLLASTNTSSFPSRVREVKICGNQLLIAGTAVGVGGTIEATVALYNLPNMTLEGYMRISQLSAGGKAANLLKDGNTIYFEVSGMNTSSNYRSSFGNNPVTFASPTGGINLNPSTTVGIFKFNVVNNSLDQVKYESETEMISFKSKSFVKSGNNFYYAKSGVAAITGEVIIVKKDASLNTVGTCSLPFSFVSSDTPIGVYRKYNIIVNEENGTEYLYVYVHDYNNQKGLRKINAQTMTVDPNFNDVCPLYVSVASPFTEKLIKCNDRISILYTNYGYVYQGVIDVALNGDVISYKKLAANNTDMSARNGVSTLTGCYNSTLNKVIFSGLVGKSATDGSVPFYGQELPVGTRIASYEYTPAINPVSDMNMTIPAYPSANIQRVINSFYVTGIPSSAYGSITLSTPFVNSGTSFAALAGNGNSLTKNFNDAVIDIFGAVKQYTSSTLPYYHTWEVSNFTVRMGSALSAEDFNLTKKESLYPNPTSGTLYVSESMMSDFDHVEIFDISGRLISSSKLQSEISLNDQRPGMFFVRLFNSETNVSDVQKIIKNN